MLWMICWGVVVVDVEVCPLVVSEATYQEAPVMAPVMAVFAIRKSKGKTQSHSDTIKIFGEKMISYFLDLVYNEGSL